LMAHTMRGWLSYLMTRFGYLPRDARVDPAAFPEETYPVYCLQCGYVLHGLAVGCCPECGAAFERGHLLVELYARARLPGPRGRRMRRLGSIASGLTGAFCLSIVALWLANTWDHERTAVLLVRTSPLLLLVPLGVTIFGIAMGGVLQVVQVALLPPRNRRRAVTAVARERARGTLPSPLARRE